MAEIPAEAFLHPFDRRAMQVMQTWITSKPKVNARFQKVMDSYVSEAVFYNLADNTRIGERQAPKLYECVTRVATSLGIRTPDVFIDSDPYINASAVSGSTNAALVFTTALLDSFTLDEVAAVAGHELGHVVADHSFFSLVAGSGFPVVEKLLSAVPGGSLAALGLQYLLHDWYRKGELTADRAALIATGDLEAVQTVIVKLAGGTDTHRIDTEEFRTQATEYRELLLQREEAITLMKRVEQVAAALMAEGEMRSHPWPALRFLEITEWSESDQYAAVIGGDLDRAASYGQDENPKAADVSRAETVADGAKKAAEGLKGGLRAARGKLDERRKK